MAIDQRAHEVVDFHRAEGLLCLNGQLVVDGVGIDQSLVAVLFVNAFSIHEVSNEVMVGRSDDGEGLLFSHNSAAFRPVLEGPVFVGFHGDGHFVAVVVGAAACGCATFSGIDSSSNLESLQSEVSHQGAVARDREGVMGIG